LLRPTADMAGTIDRGGKAESLDSNRSLALAEGDWGQLDLGVVHLFFRVGSEAVALPGGATLAAVSTPMLGSLLGAMTVHLGLLIAAFLLFDDAPKFVDLENRDRFVKVMSEAPQQEIEEAMESESLTEDVAPAPPEKESSFGKIEEAKDPKFVKNESNDTRVQRVDGTILMKELSNRNGVLKNVFGNKEGLTSKLDMAMEGTSDRIVQAGGGGLGLRGTGGPGGGGKSFGRIGGRGLGVGNGFGTGGRRTKSRLRRQTKKRRVVHSKPQVLGGQFCKSKDIQRVVKARSRGVQYCYDKALAANPELSGKLMVSWRIGLDGRVAKARVESNTLGNRDVGNCVQRAIKRWRFPKPEGGQCQIRYPFVFSAGL
jgi:TonB family protein